MNSFFDAFDNLSNALPFLDDMIDDTRPFDIGEYLDHLEARTFVS